MDLLGKIFDFSAMFRVFGQMGQVLHYIWFIIFPPILYFLFKMLWLDHVQDAFMGGIKYVLLEIIPPKEIEKSPKLMESFFAGIAGMQKGFNANEEFILGQLPQRISLELVSVGGEIHFYIRVPKPFRNLIEANLYAQYPDSEITEVPDYVENVPKIVPSKDWDLWGTDFALVKPDAYPIKTYTYFEEDVTGKMIDPLSSILEVMGKLPPDQQIWFQCVIYPESEAWVAKGKQAVQELAGRVSKTSTGADKLVNDLLEVIMNIPRAIMASELKFGGEDSPKEQQPLDQRMTPIEKDVLKALETNIGKNVFRTKMRFLYLGRRENFSKANVSSFMGSLKQFSDLNLNSFKPDSVSKTAAAYFRVADRMLFKQRRIFKRYLSRDMTGSKFYLSTAELATLFHLPDMSVMAPSLTRIASKRGGAPPNLPME